MWVEKAVAYFKPMSWHSMEGLRKSVKNRSSRFRQRDSNHITYMQLKKLLLVHIYFLGEAEITVSRIYCYFKEGIFWGRLVTVSSVFKQPWQRSRYNDWLRSGRPRGRTWSPGGFKDFHFSISSRPAVGPFQTPI
jgi:hypothetical protein